MQKLIIGSFALLAALSAFTMLIGMMTREWGFAAGGMIGMASFGMLASMLAER